MADLISTAHPTLDAVVKSTLLDLQRMNDNAEVETVTTGAISITKLITLLSVTGTVAFTLANGTKVGQRKILVCVVAASTPVGNVAGTFTGSGAQLGAFGVLNECAELVWTGSAWAPVAMNGVAIL